jgi:hypothetical protein
MAVSQTKAPRVAVVTEAGEMTTVSRATAGAGPVGPAGRLGQPTGAALERIIGLEEHFVTADVLDAWRVLDLGWRDLALTPSTEGRRRAARLTWTASVSPRRRKPGSTSRSNRRTHRCGLAGPRPC